jgi:hypothetical protein
VLGRLGLEHIWKTIIHVTMIASTPQPSNIQQWPDRRLWPETSGHSRNRQQHRHIKPLSCLCICLRLALVPLDKSMALLACIDQLNNEWSSGGLGDITIPYHTAQFRAYGR